MLTPLVTVAGLVYSQYAGRAIYADASPSALAFTVRAGPFQGIATSATRFAILTQLAVDLPKVVNPIGRILCYPHFAACYLMTSMRPASPHCWVGGLYERHARWYAERASPHDVIVRLKYKVPELRPLDEVALDPGRRVINRREYAIFSGPAERSAGDAAHDDPAGRLKKRRQPAATTL